MEQKRNKLQKNNTDTKKIASSSHFDYMSGSHYLFIYFKSETTSIWIPDYDLLNQVESVQGFAASQAIVNSDGTVTWGHS
jgi:hypothetical protein